MTDKEISLLLAINQTTYPYAYKDMSKEQREILRTVWHNKFKDYESEVISHAFYKALEICKMPVTIADIFTQLSKIKQSQATSDDELWDKFLEAAENCSTLSQYFNYSMRESDGRTQGDIARERTRDIFNELPPEIKAFCGSVHNLIDYGKVGRKELNQFTKPQFLKRMTAIKERAEVLEETPEEILQLIGDTAAKVSMRLIGGK